eukprot:7962594-Pyramimonas_sp.AAC.1
MPRGGDKRRAGRHARDGGALPAGGGGAQMATTRMNNITSFYGSSCANNGKGALNTPETTTIMSITILQLLQRKTRV